MVGHRSSLGHVLCSVLVITSFAVVNLQNADHEELLQMTIVPDTHGLKVNWTAPKIVSANQTINIYRVLVYPKKWASQRRVYWSSVNDPLQQTVSCLQPSTVYVVQLLARYKQPELEDDRSAVVELSTLAQESSNDFLVNLPEQWLYVCFGAGLMAVFILMCGFIMCCCCKIERRRSGGKDLNHDSSAKALEAGANTKPKKQKPKSLPHPRDICYTGNIPSNGSSHSMDPIRTTSYRPRPSDVSTTQLIQADRDSTNSAPFYPAPPPPHMSCLPEVGSDDVFEPDSSIYQNTCLAAGGSGTKARSQTMPVRLPDTDCHIYGNSRF